MAPYPKGNGHWFVLGQVLYGVCSCVDVFPVATFVSMVLQFESIICIAIPPLDVIHSAYFVASCLVGLDDILHPAVLGHVFGKKNAVRFFLSLASFWA